MPRYEITGSGVGCASLPLDKQAEILRAQGARNVRRAYHYGLSNQPYTLRFTAPDWTEADRMVSAVDLANNPERRLGGGGGLLRAYPVKKSE